MRPNISDELGKDVETVVSEISSIDVEKVGFGQQLRILLANLGEIETSDGGVQNRVGEVREKYR